ncbi:crotonobetainyl-CoA:carnitine CoA-transferase CaiB-like acyl-CoA transferase [Filimonas zeae]|uniref:CoA transferase n=1 Tax=Filimonas zeae TaxID=1737353 RepID=A0A917IRI3_9BACT|nr:CaiB/BaiF CoA-transferase family protein [Filimonas zeae]MDR6337808.1 crotonobetainyl-CoA:carnitine CoA-transferase CaiB-like acyl-CoA transferase [Filimonas zeae]GGH60359.1 CoA transferase [Filimonas zeae]
MSVLPLKGLVVLEFSQYLSGPSAGLRMADLGARVIKIERPGSGEAGRKLSIKNLWADDGSSLLFHTINRNKESFTADLKNAEDLDKVKQLIRQADVLTHNFRPGVMEKAGLGYAEVRKLNPRMVYAEISGYGKRGPWKNRPGQDLLLQSMSGLAYTTGDAGKGPIPFGLSIGDSLCGAQLVQGILAALIRRQKTGQGALIEISLLESLLDFQFELLTTYFASGKQPQRSQVNNGHSLLSAPYGIYATSKGYIAVAMSDLQQVAKAVQCDDLLKYTQNDAFSKRDEIKQCIADHLLTNTAAYWQQQLLQAGLWAMEVQNWQQLVQLEGYRQLQMEQPLRMKDGSVRTTTRCPIRINGQKLFSPVPAPVAGEHNKTISREFLTSIIA